VQAFHLILILAAALAGALIGAVTCRWHLRQRLAQLQQRLKRSEEARNGAIERGAQAREQLAQLSKAIAEMRKSHQPVRDAQPSIVFTEDRRATAERALDEASAADNASPQWRKAALFADTEPFVP